MPYSVYQPHNPPPYHQDYRRVTAASPTVSYASHTPSTTHGTHSSASEYMYVHELERRNNQLEREVRRLKEEVGVLRERVRGYEERVREGSEDEMRGMREGGGRLGGVSIRFG